MKNIREKISKELIEGELTPDEVNIQLPGRFVRKISNFDGVTCWLNSLIQLLLNAFDHQSNRVSMESRLGKMLEKSQSESLIDPRPVKHLLQEELEMRAVRYQEILQDEQCAREALIILSENKDSWKDLYKLLNHSVRQTSTCLSCNNQYSFDIEQLYSEVMCPENNVSLKNMLENTMNREEVVEFRCEKCHISGGAKLNFNLITEESSEFLIIQVKRGIENYTYSNNVKATEDVNLLDSSGVQRTYTPIAIIHHRGGLGLSVRSSRHYMCDVRSQEDMKWYHTSDAATPIPLSVEKVSTKAFIVLYKRCV